MQQLRVTVSAKQVNELVSSILIIEESKEICEQNSTQNGLNQSRKRVYFQLSTPSRKTSTLTCTRVLEQIG